MGKAKKAKEKQSATPKTGLAANRRRRRARTVTKTSTTRTVTSNPPIAADFLNVLLPGFGAYAATRVLSRIVYSLVQKRWPSMGKHAAAVAGAAAFGGVWFFAHKVKKLAPYHDGIVMGSGVAALHGIATCYLPTKYSWLLTDCKPEDVATVAPSTDLPAMPATTAIPAAGDDEYSYLERQLEAIEGTSSKRPRTVAAPRSSGRPVARAMKMAQGDAPDSDLDLDLTSELEVGENVDDLYSGAFEN